MTSSHSSRVVPNQFIITTEEGKYFQSYNSVIAFTPWATEEKLYSVFLDKNFWDYSTTTGKYRNEFLGEDKKETQRKINAGIYKLVDLNA